MTLGVDHLANLWHADNQGAFSQSGYRICPITCHMDKNNFDLLLHKMPQKVDFFFPFFKGNPKSKMVAAP